MADEFDAAQRRRHAEAVLRAAIAAADPRPLVERALQGAPELHAAKRIQLLAIGKAAPAMAAAAESVLGARMTERLLVAPRGTPAPAGTLFGGHPLPDEDSVAAGRAVLGLLGNAAADEIVLVLISGGASSCCALPLGPIRIDEYAWCVRSLMQAGADIVDLNTVRKHIDALKGGRMALHAAPAAVLSLVLSDVVGDALDVIASGPLTPDSTTCDDALHVLRRHDLLEPCPLSIRVLLEECGDESPAEDDPAFQQVRVRIVGGNDVAVEGAAAEAERLGYRVRRATHPVTGPAREAGAGLAREARLLQRAGELPVCIVAGGETTVAAKGSGRGGRNQEIVLAACLELNGQHGITVGSVGTDGVDGNSPAAGAIADEASMPVAREHGIDLRSIVAQNDSYTFFKATAGVIETGATGTNVNDVQIALVSGQPPVCRIDGAVGVSAPMTQPGSITVAG
jgi:glycerate 2-kinase